MRTLSERTVSASLVILGGTGCYFILSIAIQSLIGHLGGPIALGRYAAALMAVEFVATIILLGTPNAVNRFTSLFISTGRRKETRSLISGLLVFIVVASLVINALVVLLFDLLRNSHILDKTLRHADLLFIILGSTSLAISKSIATFYHADYKNIKGALIFLSAPLITFGLVVMNYAQIWRLTLVQSVSLGFMASALFSLALSGLEKDLSIKPRWIPIRDLVIFSFPLFGVSVVAYFSTWADRIIVGLTSSIANLGILSAAVAIVRAIRFIPQALTPVFVTTYSRFLSDSTRSRKLSTAFSMDLFFVCFFCLGIASTIYIWAQKVVQLLWGHGFGSLVVSILRIELIGLIGLAHSLQTPNFLIVMGRPGLNLRLALIHISIQSVLSILLLKGFGIVGIALASASTLIFMAFFRHKVITHNLGIRIKTRPIFELIAAFGLSVVFYHVAAWTSWIPPIGVSILGNLVAAILFIVVFIRTPFAPAILKTALQKTLSRTRSLKDSRGVELTTFEE